MIECKKHKIVTLVGGDTLCIHCGECWLKKTDLRPPLRPIHRIIFETIAELFPLRYRRVQTSFLWSEMWRYAWEKKVFRVTLMGETRGGKSEEAQTIATNWCIIFTALWKEGHYKNIDITYDDGKKIDIKPIELKAEYIHANQSVYLYHLRDQTKEKKLLFGNMHIIDEERDNPGGIGSFTEDVETENLNNIVAKFMQCEIWITPKRFQIMNTPYGINVQIKDENTRTNWGLLYKLEMNSAGLNEQNFLGWVGVGLHEDKKLREAYQEKKNKWIEAELSGTINERVLRRKKAVEYLLSDPMFSEHVTRKDGTIHWKHGIEAMKFLVEEAMSQKKIDPFNDSEIERIVHGARALGEKTFNEVQHEEAK